MRTPFLTHLGTFSRPPPGRQENVVRNDMDGGLLIPAGEPLSLQGSASRRRPETSTETDFLDKCLSDLLETESTSSAIHFDERPPSEMTDFGPIRETPNLFRSG